MKTKALAEFQAVLAAHGMSLDAAEAREFAITLIDLIASGLLAPAQPPVHSPSAAEPLVAARKEGCGRAADSR